MHYSVTAASICCFFLSPSLPVYADLMISPLYSMLCPPLFPLFSCLVSPPPRSYFLDTPFYSLFPFSCLSCFPYLSYTALRAQYTYILYSTFQQKACLLRGGNNISPALPHSIPLSFMISPCASLSLSLSHHTASFSGLLDADWEQQTRDSGPEREKEGSTGEEGGGGEGRRGLPWLPTATPLSVTASSPSLSPSPSPYPSPLGWRGRKRREGEVAAVDAAAAISGVRGASFIPPPDLPLLYSICDRAPKEEAAGHGGLPRREASVPGCSPSPGPLPGSGSPESPDRKSVVKGKSVL